MDLILQLPSILAQREKELEQYRRDQRLVALNKSLEGSGLSICRDGPGHYLLYRADLDRLETVAKQIVNAEEIFLAPLDLLLESKLVTFTSEGGFSLN